MTEIMTAEDMDPSDMECINAMASKVLDSKLLQKATVRLPLGNNKTLVVMNNHINHTSIERDVVLKELNLYDLILAEIERLGSLKALDRKIILAAHAKYGGTGKAAKPMGMSRQVFYINLKKARGELKNEKDLIDGGNGDGVISGSPGNGRSNVEQR